MERYIQIPGGNNIRDLGGYKTRDDGRVKWRKIFRSGLLSNIDSNAVEEMKAIQLQSICDFRTEAEQTAKPDNWYLLEQLNRYSLPIGEGRVDKLNWLNETSFQAGEGHHLYKANRSYVLKEAHRFKAFFQILLKENNYPILYHCTAGKDRTGFASYLLLSVLGVDWETIRADYLLTNQYLTEFAKRNSAKLAQELGIEQQKIQSIFQAKEAYLKGATDAILATYGSTEQYLQQALGIGQSEIQQLKNTLVEY